LIAKNEHSTTGGSNPTNVHPGKQPSATTAVDNEGCSWGTPWSTNDTLKVSNPEKNKSSHMTISQTNDFKILMIMISGLMVPNENKSEGKVVTWETPCSVSMHSSSNKRLNVGDSFLPVKEIKNNVTKNDCTEICKERNSFETIRTSNWNCGNTMGSITIVETKFFVK